MNKFTLTASAMAGLAILAPGAVAADFFLSPAGNDRNPGTRDQPLATLASARDAARKAGAATHRIALLPGDYFLSQTLELDARDNGLTIEAVEPGKAVIYGGSPVTGWKRDGEKFWCADLPGVREGSWDFRALVVNGRMAERARLPETGAFQHNSVFDVRWLSSVGGGWERKPTEEELTTLLYRPGDIPPALEPRNAELRIYHMWDESLCGVARNDPQQHRLTFSTPAKSPPGAFGVKKYVVLNTREGMSRPGQWYLDRAAGRVVYWPLAGEDMTGAKAVAPRLERVIRIAGTAKQAAAQITLRGFSLQAATTPLKSGGFAASAFAGALSVQIARGCTFEKLDIGNVAGQAIEVRQAAGCSLRDNHIHHVGACGIRAEGSDNEVVRNHIHHIGAAYPSAVAVSVSTPNWRSGDQGFRVFRNEIHDTPYSGVIGSGGNHRIEENLISRVMRELQDGGAIYGGMSNCVLRGNLVRDVVKMGEGYGVSSYYLDEGARDCVVERNVSIGVERPTHNHIATNITIRDNVFIAERDMALSFARSGGCTFERNTLFVPGEITVGQPSAIKLWKDNVVFRSGLDKGGAAQAFTIGEAMPPVTAPARRNYSTAVERMAQPPVLDGEIGWEEWPRPTLNIDREPSRWSASGAPVYAKLGYDAQCLYAAVNVTMFEPEKLRAAGAEWGKDDGVEICIRGEGGEGKPADFVIRGFAGGKLASAGVAGAPAEAAATLGNSVRFAAKPYGRKWGGGWRCEWAIPWQALGVEPAAGRKLAFNLGVYRAEDGVWRAYEGTLAENWRLDQAGMLQLK